MLNFDNDNNLEDRKFYLDLESLKLRKFLEKEINYGIFGTSAPLSRSNNIMMKIRRITN